MRKRFIHSPLQPTTQELVQPPDTHDVSPKKLAARAPRLAPLPAVAIEPVQPAWWDRSTYFYKAAAVLLLCMIGVVVLSHYVLNSGSLQLDEAQSLWQASHSVSGVLHVVALDVHVPLYHMLLHFWLIYVGRTIQSARLISLIFFLATIPLFYLLARQVLSRRLALLATVLFSFSPFMTWYANVARMYTMLAFFTTLSQLLFLKLLKHRRVWRAYAISSVIGAYSHYFFSFNLAAEGIFFLMSRKHFRKGDFKRLVLVGLLVTAALAPWLIYFFYLGAAGDTRPIIPRPSTVDFFNVYSQFLFGFQNDHINTILVSTWPIVMLFGFLAVRRNQKLTPEIGFMANMAFLPVVMAFALSYVTTPFFLSRYLISSVAPLLIFIIWLCSYYGKTLGRALITLLVLVLLLSSYQQDTSSTTPVVEDYRGAAQYVNSHAKPQDIVVLSSPFTVYPFEYYYHAHASITTLPIWDRSAAGKIPAFKSINLAKQVKQVDANHGDVFLLLSYNQGYENNIQQYYLKHFKQLYRHQYSNDLTLYEFQMRYYNVPALGSPATLITPAEASKP